MREAVGAWLTLTDAAAEEVGDELVGVVAAGEALWAQPDRPEATRTASARATDHRMLQATLPAT
jgi:hypothetical protein